MIVNMRAYYCYHFENKFEKIKFIQNLKHVWQIHLTKFIIAFIIKRVFLKAKIDVVHDASIMKLFNKIVNQDAHVHHFHFDKILFLMNFAFDRNAVETQNIFINSSIRLFHFLMKHDVLQQMFVQFKNFIVHMIFVFVENEANFFKINFAKWFKYQKKLIEKDSLKAFYESKNVLKNRFQQNQYIIKKTRLIIDNLFKRQIYRSSTKCWIIEKFSLIYNEKN